MRWARAGAVGLGAVGLGVIPAGSAAAQSRVLVPIVIQAPRASSSSSAATPTIRVQTGTVSPQPGVTATRVTVTNTTGAGRTVGVTPPATVRATVAPGTPSVLVIVDRRLGPDGGGVPGETRLTVRDVSRSQQTLGVPPATSVRQAASPGQQTFIITSEAPIDAPIVILGP